MDHVFEPTELMELIEKAESRVNSYWNFYIIVVVATVGWLMSSRTPFTLPQTVALSIALSGFFTANFGVIRAATRRILALEDELTKTSRKLVFSSDALRSNLSKASVPGRLGWSYGLHLVIDIAVLFAVWSKIL